MKGEQAVAGFGQGMEQGQVGNGPLSFLLYRRPPGDQGPPVGTAG